MTAKSDNQPAATGKKRSAKQISSSGNGNKSDEEHIDPLASFEREGDPNLTKDSKFKANQKEKRPANRVRFQEKDKVAKKSSRAAKKQHQDDSDQDDEMVKVDVAQIMMDDDSDQ